MYESPSQIPYAIAAFGQIDGSPADNWDISPLRTHSSIPWWVGSQSRTIAKHLQAGSTRNRFWRTAVFIAEGSMFLYIPGRGTLREQRLLEE